MSKNSIIIDMIKREANDPEFKEQIKNAKPATKEFLNEIFKTLKTKHTHDWGS